MDDSIINIEDCDSFSLSSDTDIKSIVDQWKHRDNGSDLKDLKHVDTRTFTRPKKRLFAAPESNGMLFERRENIFKEESSDDQAHTSRAAVPTINLKIGGLVTSMQKSFLGDVSPPNNMDSSMGNSWITSMDFKNIEFMNGNDESLSLANFNQYRLSDAINDRNFLERLTNYDESLFTKDADINNIDGNHLINNGTLSSDSTLQNSTDSGKNDETFVAPNGQMNGTFDAVGEVDRTFIQAPDLNESNSRNGTFDCGVKQNTTFDAKQIPTDFHKTTDALEDEVLSLYDDSELSIKTDDTIEFKKPEGFGLPSAIRNLSPKRDSNSNVQNSELDDFQSTPARRDMKKKRQSSSLANISPILAEDMKQQNFEKFIDVEIDEFPVQMRSSRSYSRQASNPTGVNYELREKQRQSLANFEDVENTLLILENKNEEEFDDLLNTFNSSNTRSPLSQKVRQSLHNIKKRHSFMGMEKQQQDELSREKTMTMSPSEKNRMNKSFTRTAMGTSMSSSGNGERLLRRSRLFDDINTSGSSINDIELQTSSSGSSIGFGDNRQANEHNTTEVLNRKNQTYIDEENPEPKTDRTLVYNTDDTPSEGKPNNGRDRFKTIRIFKKPPENAVQVPDYDDESNVEAVHTRSQSTGRALDAFAMKNTNSPQTHHLDDYEQSSPSAKAINTMTFKRPALARPKQFSSGLQKRELYAKSNSHELLSSDDQVHVSSKMHTTAVPQLKSPMGIKSKSIHNLTSTRNNTSPTSRMNTQPTVSSSNTFRAPAARPLATMRQRTDIGQPKKLTLIRPSSGYYGYNTKRLDSDNESAKFSSNNSLSSASSKSSVSRGETPETQYENPNSTFVQPTVKAPNVPSRSTASTTATNPSNIGQPRASLLRPPTQIRRSALPRPTTFAKR